LLANGVAIREAIIDQLPDSRLPTGVQWIGNWTIPQPKHDVNLVAVATGVGVDGSYWHTAKPYQPLSPDWQPNTLACSGAVWLDSDNDGKPTAARHYAERLVAAADGDWAKLIAQLSAFDEAVAAHAAYLVAQSGTALESESLQKALMEGAAATQAGFQAYRQAARESEIARAAP
jgi:hypothetical protein